MAELHNAHLTVTVDFQGCGDLCGCHLPPREHGRLHTAIHVGAPRHTTPAERATGGDPSDRHHHRRVSTIMDLKVDQELPLLDPAFSDEAGDPVPAPEGATTVYTSDNDAAAFITTADDGTQVIRSAGVLSDDGAGGGVGAANVHSVTTWTGTDGGELTSTGDLQVVIVAGDAQRTTINVGAPREITPDA